MIIIIIIIFGTQPKFNQSRLLRINSAQRSNPIGQCTQNEIEKKLRPNGWMCIWKRKEDDNTPANGSEFCSESEKERNDSQAAEIFISTIFICTYRWKFDIIFWSARDRVLVGNIWWARIQPDQGQLGNERTTYNAYHAAIRLWGHEMYLSMSKIYTWDPNHRS